METSSLICSSNQWTGFYMITASVMKGLSKSLRIEVFHTDLVYYQRCSFTSSYFTIWAKNS